MGPTAGEIRLMDLLNEVNGMNGNSYESNRTSQRSPGTLSAADWRKTEGMRARFREYIARTAGANTSGFRSALEGDNDRVPLATEWLDGNGL
jgi:hypothetical protein